MIDKVIPLWSEGQHTIADLTIGYRVPEPILDVAARTGLENSALRYYEAQGLIDSARTEGGQRRFDRDS